MLTKLMAKCAFRMNFEKCALTFSNRQNEDGGLVLWAVISCKNKTEFSFNTNKIKSMPYRTIIEDYFLCLVYCFH